MANKIKQRPSTRANKPAGKIPKISKKVVPSAKPSKKPSVRGEPVTTFSTPFLDFLNSAELRFTANPNELFFGIREEYKPIRRLPKFSPDWPKASYLGVTSTSKDSAFHDVALSAKVPGDAVIFTYDGQTDRYIYNPTSFSSKLKGKNSGKNLKEVRSIYIAILIDSLLRKYTSKVSAALDTKDNSVIPLEFQSAILTTLDFGYLL